MTTPRDKARGHWESIERATRSGGMRKSGGEHGDYVWLPSEAIDWLHRVSTQLLELDNESSEDMRAALAYATGLTGRTARDDGPVILSLRLYQTLRERGEPPEGSTALDFIAKVMGWDKDPAQTPSDEALRKRITRALGKVPEPDRSELRKLLDQRRAKSS